LTNNDKKHFTKKPKQIIEEDEYFRILEEIIRRDYFPDLLKVDAIKKYETYQMKNRLDTGSTNRTNRPPSILLKSSSHYI